MDLKDPIVRLKRAEPVDRDVFANLLQFYLYDLATDLSFSVGRDGRFEYTYLDRFWRHPYLFLVEEQIAGFALAIDECPISGKKPCLFMAEFFVLRGHRRKGVGETAANAILKLHSGLWHIGVIQRNADASAFWSKVLACCNTVASSHHFDGEDWQLHEFQT